ncbi:hypothetical protein [Bradyrhizobium elkanii]|nr:trehalose-6-phosphate synthase [Bradyrhizobium elkanii]MCS4066876.1 trehalose-6-phosphate synthase [Bradyrhizobium elkanii]MCS4082411.1 trehalose-6-phosphate synthase [Bradyrhizobium elkanii]MCW2174753.1 trehalose-6-phosphate synthase [Bradyrhizobium elkanii]
MLSQPDLKLVVISNRVAPFDPSKPQTGGLAAALEPVVERSGAVWVGSSENRGDGTEQPLPLVPTGAGQVARLDLPAADYPGYYRGFSNSTLWPALHSLPNRMSGADAVLADRAGSDDDGDVNELRQAIMRGSMTRTGAIRPTYCRYP